MRYYLDFITEMEAATNGETMREFGQLSPFGYVSWRVIDEEEGVVAYTCTESHAVALVDILNKGQEQ